MENEKRLIEIPADGIIRIPIMDGDSTVGERIIDLSNLPTVDAVEVVYGRWKERHISFIGQTKYFCSECLTFHNCKSNYCPSCGAKMDGDKNE